MDAVTAASWWVLTPGEPRNAERLRNILNPRIA
jgi:hypothetical protein